MAAHRHPVGFEFSVEMGIFQTTFLDLKKKKTKKTQSTKQNHPILRDPAPAFVVQSLLCFAVQQNKYILEVLHKARKLMKGAPEVTVFPSSMYLGVFQRLWMVS